MKVILATLIIAIVLGFLLGGRLSNLACLRIRWMPLAIAGLALQLVPMPGRAWSLALLYVSFALLVAFAVANGRAGIPGAWLILAGILLNLTVIGLNQGMPVAREALVRSDQMDTLELLAKQGGAKHHLARPTDRVVFLADVIPIRPIRQIVSLGDLVAYAGVVWLVVAGMRGRPEEVAPASTVRTSGSGEVGGVG
jgi:Family of unknown function (DUF5317)